MTGSLRKASVNAGLLRAAAALAPKHDMSFTILSSDLPLFNEDLEVGGVAGNARLWLVMRLLLLTSSRPSGLPESVKSLRAQIAAADALFFGLEEFNGSVSGNGLALILYPQKHAHDLPTTAETALCSPLAAGVLKNAIDWASRSYEGADSPLKGKFSAAVGAGGRGGAARAHVALRPILNELGCIHMPAPELQIQRWGPGPATFDANGSISIRPVFSPTTHASAFPPPSLTSLQATLPLRTSSRTWRM